MQSYIHAKNNPNSTKQKTKRVSTAEKESKSAEQLSGKFKLSTWSRKPRRKVKSEIQKERDVSNSTALSKNHDETLSNSNSNTVINLNFPFKIVDSNEILEHYYSETISPIWGNPHFVHPTVIETTLSLSAHSICCTLPKLASSDSTSR